MRDSTNVYSFKPLSQCLSILFYNMMMKPNNDGEANKASVHGGTVLETDMAIVTSRFYSRFYSAETAVQVDMKLPPFPSQISLLTATIQELQIHLSSGLITSQQLTQEYLVRHPSSKNRTTYYYRKAITDCEQTESHRAKQLQGS
jgi:hypothetical protein